MELLNATVHQRSFEALSVARYALKVFGTPIPQW